jgi:hypothetical protein
MKIAPTKTGLLALSFLCICASDLYAQDDKTTLTQDPKFEQLLAEKRKINTSITVNDKYKIQVYNGDSETAKKTLIDFKKEYKNLDGTIVFSTPAYKVWVGNFRSRIEAERNLAELRKKYPNALLIKPNK